MVLINNKERLLILNHVNSELQKEQSDDTLITLRGLQKKLSGVDVLKDTVCPHCGSHDISTDSEFKKCFQCYCSW